MEISPQDARKSLDDVQRITEQTRRVLASGGAPYYLLLWGAIWLVGFTLTQFVDERAWVLGMVWGVLDLIGAIGSAWIGFRLSQRVRSQIMSVRIGLFWLALLGYAALLVFLSRPDSKELIALLIVVMAMFGYVAMGLWLNSAVIVWIGLGVTLLSLLGYFFLRDFFSLWMAVLGGGTLMASGWWMLKAWR